MTPATTYVSPAAKFCSRSWRARVAWWRSVHAAENRMTDQTPIRRCTDQDLETVLAIINEAAEAYRGVIPADRWHEPYMSMAELRRDVEAGVAFWVYDAGGIILGVMGIQPVEDVNLIRHAYVRPGNQRGGIGAALLGYLRAQATRRMLVGTWADATWAISFYERNGFKLVPREEMPVLARRYWSIPQRQIETSVVLSEVTRSASPQTFNSRSP
jgi:GNAT superfamily N-acetyltransferase